MWRKKEPLILCVLLAAVTLAAFWQVGDCGFITLDDDAYVTKNEHVREGITLRGIAWAFTAGHASNWHPLTWLSHMLDAELFGLQPRRHHLTNLAFHIANTLLLFAVFHRMTKALWRSAFLAALFALHPLHVESVAWVSERKDVLSTLFWLLTTGAYILYAEGRGLRISSAVLAFLVLGLMSKPMLVTLPVVLLLLDYWPLSRMAAASGLRPSWASIRPLIREKIPLFAIAALSAIITYAVQHQGGAVRSFESFPVGVRMANAVVSSVLYIEKMFWPRDLAVFYPHPGPWPLWQVFGALAFLLAVTFLVLRASRRAPYLAVGWLWYGVTLLPVLGIVQIGSHGMADRYTYVPLIGLFVMVAWGVPDLLNGWRFRREALVASSALILLCLFSLTRAQVGYWQSSMTLYDHTLKVTGGNGLIHHNRGVEYARLGDYARAIEDFDRAVEINPRFALAYVNRGVASGRLGRHERAIEDFDRAIEINPHLAMAYFNRGVACRNLGDPVRAIGDFDRAIEINPGYAAAYFDRGLLHGRMGNHRQALADLQTAARLGNEDARNFLQSRGVNW